jgi:hypothetical protein
MGGERKTADMIDFLSDLYDIFCALLLVGAAVLVVVYLVRYFMGRSDCHGKISYRQFRSLYAIAPEKWEIDDGLYVGYRLRDPIRDPARFEFSWDVPRRFFYFSLIDAVRFDLWRLRVNSEKEKREKNEKLAEVIECWQHDIDEYRKALEVRK